MRHQRNKKFKKKNLSIKEIEIYYFYSIPGYETAFSIRPITGFWLDDELRDTCIIRSGYIDLTLVSSLLLIDALH